LTDKLSLGKLINNIINYANKIKKNPATVINMKDTPKLLNKKANSKKIYHSIYTISAQTPLKCIHRRQLSKQPGLEVLINAFQRMLYI